MATYILLASFTDQGIRKIKDSPKRADAFKDMAKKCGATVKDVFWTLGEYDIVAVVEAPDDISMTALGLSSGALGKYSHTDPASVYTGRHEDDPWQDGQELNLLEVQCGRSIMSPTTGRQRLWVVSRPEVTACLAPTR
jgi:uncharacterized protein with GYD domain